MPTNTQEQSQAASREYPFKPGRSGNRSGKSRTQPRYDAYVELFVGVQGRRPNAIESSQISSAAALAARIEGNRIPIEEQVRAGNLLARIVEKLGLDRAPEPPPKNPVDALREHCAGIEATKNGVAEIPVATVTRNGGGA